MNPEYRKARQVEDVVRVLAHLEHGGTSLPVMTADLVEEAIAHIWFGRYGLAHCALDEAISAPRDTKASELVPVYDLRQKLKFVDSFPALAMPQFAEC